MAIIIVAGVLGGKKLDEVTGNYPLFTIILSLLAVFAAIYRTIKNLIK